MKAIPLHEVSANMRVVISSSDNIHSLPMTVKGVGKDDGVGWQETVVLSLVDQNGRSHTLVAGIRDFLNSGNQIFALA
jgi:hypothetical protein